MHYSIFWSKLFVSFADIFFSLFCVGIFLENKSSHPSLSQYCKNGQIKNGQRDTVLSL